MKSFYKKALASFICLTMIFTMSTSLSFATVTSDDVATSDDVVQSEQTVDVEATESEENEIEVNAEDEEIDTSESGTLTPMEEETGDQDASITILSSDGTEVVVTGSDIEKASKVEVTQDDPWGFNSGATQVYGTFYSFSDVLTKAGITDIDDAHGIKVVAADGFVSGYTTEEIASVYIYKGEDVFFADDNSQKSTGKFNMAINGSAGSKWATNVATVSVADDHAWGTKNMAHKCTICNAAEPSITVANAEGTETTIYQCDIESVEPRTVTRNNAWEYKTKSGGYKQVYGTFYSLSEALTKAGVTGIDDGHGIKVLSENGSISGYTVEEIASVYIYKGSDVFVISNSGQANDTQKTTAELNMAIVSPITGDDNTSVESDWPTDVKTISVVSEGEHVYGIEDGNCTHKCAICDVAEPGITVVDPSDSEKTITAYQCDVSALTDSTEALKLASDVESAITLDIGEGKTIKLDLDGNDINGNIEVASGTLVISGEGEVNGYITIAEGANFTAAGGSYSFELEEANCAEGVVPVYNAETKLYDIKAVSAYDSQTSANEQSKLINALQYQIYKLQATLEANSVDVTATAKATAYNEVTLTIGSDNEAADLKVEKKVDGTWTEIDVQDNKYVDEAELGIENSYRVTAGIYYETEEGQDIALGKPVTASATPSLAKTTISKVTTKSKKLTATWKAVSGATSYDVYVGTNSGVTKGLVKYTNKKGTKLTTKALKKNTTYYVKVRARYTNSAGKTVYGAWSTAKKIKCK